jgi:transcriptional regulator with GAF, ATPase, and Fis domain/tetratricopeptide (TPR) repeat protein
MANVDEAVKQLERTRPIMDQDDLPKEVRSQVVLANAEFLFWRGHINEAVELYESVLGQYQELPRDVEMLKGFVKMGWTYGAAGETDRGVDLIMAVRERARELQARDLERYATLIQVIILADAGRIDEGQSLLEEVFSTPEEYLDHYTLWPGNGKRAYFAFLRGEHKKAFQYLCKAWENSLAMGTPHHRGPDNLEIMLDLEEEGLIHPEWNFDSDVERLLKWPDAYMRGVAYRFRAQKRLRRAEASEAVKADLQTSMDLLAESGAKLELANTRVQMARVLIAENKVPAAEKLLRSAWEVYSRVNPNLFPRDMEAYLDRTSKNALWVESLLAIGDAMGSMLTKKEFLGQIINQAMRIASAERGVVFLKQDGKLEMVSSRNLGLTETCSKTFCNQMEMVEKVFESGAELIEKTEDSPSPGTEGTTGGWMGCFPIRVKAKVLGVIFMDCRLAQSRLPESEISLLRIISNQAAVTLENLEAHEVEADLESNLEAEAQFYRETYEGGLPKGHMIGRSKPFKKMMMLINQVAKSDATVMITGETGVGKELVAQAIHQGSARSSGPFIAVNMVSLSPELMASELFGHEKGAFTGASQTRKGRFELASEGTLFLDDIDTFSLDIQAKMLRVLETREFERVGGSRTLKTSFRLVAASNRDIEELVEQGLFRSDFYYRLNVFPIKVPPLRERAEDIPVLAHYFMKMFGKKFGKVFDNISRKDLRHLLDYHWPGNLRELRHVIERAVLLGENGRLVIPSLDMSPVGGNDDEVVLPLKEMEARHIVKALTACRGKISGPGGAAQLLEVKPTTLYSKMKNLGVRREEFTIEKRSYH